MNAKSSTIAQKLLNLYRQAHVILGGWTALNPIFVAEADADVMNALRELPTGKMLARHIENLRSGKTPMDGIERDLLPYGGMMAESIPSVTVTSSQLAELESVINKFTPDQQGLMTLQSAPIIQQFGDEWIPAVRAILANHPDLLKKWAVVVQTHRAYDLWNTANQILSQPLSDRARAQIQADMPEYETYLPMFGGAGDNLLARLRTFISSVKSDTIADEQ